MNRSTEAKEHAHKAKLRRQVYRPFPSVKGLQPGDVLSEALIDLALGRQPNVEALIDLCEEALDEKSWAEKKAEEKIKNLDDEVEALYEKNHQLRDALGKIASGTNADDEKVGRRTLMRWAQEALDDEAKGVKQ